MEVSLHTEPHLLAGTVNPTVSKRNVTLAIDNGLNLVEWRQRKEQARGQVTVYGRRLRVSVPLCSKQLLTIRVNGSKEKFYLTENVIGFQPSPLEDCSL